MNILIHKQKANEGLRKFQPLPLIRHEILPQKSFLPSFHFYLLFMRLISFSISPCFPLSLFLSLSFPLSHHILILYFPFFSVYPEILYSITFFFFFSVYFKIALLVALITSINFPFPLILENSITKHNFWVSQVPYFSWTQIIACSYHIFVPICVFQNQLQVLHWKAPFRQSSEETSFGLENQQKPDNPVEEISRNWAPTWLLGSS